MIMSEIRKNTSEELLDQYVLHLYDVFPVKTDSALVDQLRHQNDQAP